MEVDRESLLIMARTVYGEARGEPWPGKLGVAWVIVNRATHGGWWGDTVAHCCLKPYQFSCWNADDPNRALIERLTLPASPLFRDCLAAACAAAFGLEADPTRGATHYHALGVHPAWAKGRQSRAVIGRHAFYGDIG